MLKRKSGFYHSRITIPQTILSPGRYSITGAIFSPGQPYPFEVKHKVISIDVIDGGTILSKFGIKIHAATTIPLNWEIFEDNSS